MINPWFKFYGSEYLSDPKIGSLSPQERSCWITLLCMAGTSSDPGIIEYLTVEVLLQKSGISFDPYRPEEWERCLGILKRLEKLKMIGLKEDGSIEVLNWCKRQETNLTAAERAKSYRDRMKTVTKSSHGNARSSPKNRIEENREEKSVYSPTSEEVAKEMEIEEAFNLFWEAYPKKEDKKVAKIRFLNLDKKSYPKIMEAIEIQKKTKQWQNRDFIPQPSTWLNQERWEDEVQTITPIDPMETYARELAKKYPPENDTTAEFKFSAKYGVDKLLKYKHIFKM